MGQTTPRLGYFKTPITPRNFALLAFVGAMLVALTSAAGELTETDVIRLARARSATVGVARAQVAVMQAAETSATLYPNPSLSWDRTHVPGGGLEGESEDTFALSLPIELSGARTARSALARSDTEAARADVSRARSHVTTRAVLVFYDAIHAERRADIVRRTVQRLQEAARVLDRRQSEGTASGYERTRLELELELAKSGLAEAMGRASSARAELGARLGIDAGSTPLRAELDVPAPSRAPVSRPSLRHDRAAAAEAARAVDGSASAWVPPVTVTGGLHVRRGLETRYGYVAGVSVALPLFARGQELRAEAQTRSRLSAARVTAAEQDAQVEIRKAESLLDSARRERARFRNAVGQRVDKLVRAAESGYREGERSVLELLDAERARAEVEGRRLDLSLAEKRADIVLRAARGELE